MPRRPRQETVGDLRKWLAEHGEPWSVDPRLADDDPLPVRPRGAQSDDEIPVQYRVVPLDPDLELGRVVGEEPPANPWLRRHWVELGLIPQDLRPTSEDGSPAP